MSVRNPLTLLMLAALLTACSTAETPSEPAVAEAAADDEPEPAVQHREPDVVLSAGADPVTIEAGQLVAASIGGWDFQFEVPIQLEAALWEGIDGTHPLVALDFPDGQATAMGVSVLGGYYRIDDPDTSYPAGLPPSGTIADILEAIDQDNTLVDITDVNEGPATTSFRAGVTEGVEPNGDAFSEIDDGRTAVPMTYGGRGAWDGSDQGVMFVGVEVGLEPGFGQAVDVDGGWVLVTGPPRHPDHDVQAAVDRIATTLEVAPTFDTTTVEYGAKARLAMAPGANTLFVTGDDVIVELDPAPIAFGAIPFDGFLSWPDFTEVWDGEEMDPTYANVLHRDADEWGAVFTIESVASVSGWRYVAPPNDFDQWLATPHETFTFDDVEAVDSPDADSAISFTATAKVDNPVTREGDVPLLFSAATSSEGLTYGWRQEPGEAAHYRLFSFDGQLHGVVAGDAGVADHIAAAIRPAS